jgi:scyllo-inositol 2-dehydrogenase (NADP+)
MISVIVIGAGRIALSHLPHILSHDDVDLVAIVEPNIISRLIFKRLFSVNVVASLDKLPIDSYDCAFILTPPQTHFSIANSLLKEGKHVFLEKPLSLNPDHSYQLVKMARKKSVQFSVGYVYRFHPVFMKVKALLESGLYGDIDSAQIDMLGNVVSAETPITWRNVGVGSGCLYDYGCHVLDLSLFLFGRPNQVTCLDKEELFQKGVVDKFEAKLSHKAESEFDCHISCNWADSSVRKAGITINIRTTKNTLWCDGQLIRIRGAIAKELSIKDLNTDVSFYLRGEEFQNQLDSFLISINQNNLSYQSAEDAALCDDLIAQLHKVNL